MKRTHIPCICPIARSFSMEKKSFHQHYHHYHIETICCHSFLQCLFVHRSQQNCSLIHLTFLLLLLLCVFTQAERWWYWSSWHKSNILIWCGYVLWTICCSTAIQVDIIFDCWIFLAFSVCVCLWMRTKNVCRVNFDRYSWLIWANECICVCVTEEKWMTWNKRQQKKTNFV